MKRTSMIGLLVMTLVLSGCGGDDDDGDKSTTTREATTTSSTVGGSTTTTAAAAFTPAAVSGLQVWVRGDAGVNASGGKVRIWEDQSGNGLHASRPETGRQPTFVPDGLNGRPALRFDGVNDAMAIPFNLSPSENASLTIFTVFSSEPVPRTKFRKLYGHDNGGFDRATGFDNRASTSFGYFAGNGVRIYFDAVPNAATLTSDVWGQTTFSGFVNGQPKVNNQPQSTGAGNATMVLGGIRDDTTIANDRDQAVPLGYEPWHGLIAEFLIYDRALGDAERQQVEQHLKAKYGIN